MTTETALPEVGQYDPTLGFVTIKVTEHWIVAIAPMLYNDRVLLMRHDEWRTGWTAGWCYDKGATAALAAMAWNPETEDAPVGFKKLAGDAR